MSYSTFGKQSRIRVRANECDATDRSLGRYYIDWTDLVDFIRRSPSVSIDEEGIPQWNYGGAIGTRYQPTLVAQYALALYDLSLSDDEACRQEFLRQANWLMSRSQRKAAGAEVWSFDFQLKRFETGVGWISALTQGNIISVLLRAYQITSEKAYLEKSVGALRAFSLPFEDGGVAAYDENGNLWFEECATAKPAHILNGFIFAIFGIQDMFRVTRLDECKVLLDEARSTLVKIMDRFDTGVWSRYDLVHDKLTSRYYHLKVHVPQLESLYFIFGDQLFLDTARRWRAYGRFPLSLRRITREDLIKSAKKKLSSIYRSVSRKTRVRASGQYRSGE